MSRGEFELFEIYTGDFIRNLVFWQKQSHDQYNLAYCNGLPHGFFRKAA